MTGQVIEYQTVHQQTKIQTIYNYLKSPTTHKETEREREGEKEKTGI